MPTIKDMKNDAIERAIKIYDRQFENWNKDFPIEKQSADEVIWDIDNNRVDDEFNIPFDKKHEVREWCVKYIKFWFEAFGVDYC